MIEQEQLLKDMNEEDINSVINKAVELQKLRLDIVKVEDMLKAKMKVYLKERGWDRYNDEKSKISISLSTINSERIDTKLLKENLSEPELAKYIRHSSYEKITIITPESRERLKKYVRTDKKPY